MKPVIVVENVSKKFSRNINTHLNYGIRDLMAEIMGRNRNTQLRKDEFIAVNDLSFALYPGDSFALIGRNGCGKTTTLNMLNGTLKPDAGRITINGRVQALIALGAGFNPKLSGRENVFNSAAVLGLNAKESRGIIDEVVDFAELDDFIDSPVQTYSSGMYARLGFSVAVHLKPEILLIDEILAVGDHAFQNKCFSKMQQLIKEGLTVVLVSHAHTRVVQLCEKAIFMHHGKTLKAGHSKEVVGDYLSFLDDQKAKNMIKKDDKKEIVAPIVKQRKKPSETIYGPFIYDSLDHVKDIFVNLFVNNCNVDSFRIYDDIVLEYGFTLNHRVDNLSVNLPIYRKEDGLHYGKITTMNEDVIKHIHEGQVRCRATIRSFNLNPGSYVIGMAIFEGHSFLYRNIAKEFQILNNGDLVWGLMGFKCKHEIL